MRPRIRSFKPDILHDEELWAIAQETQLPVLQGFAGLWCYADKEGRFEWRPLALGSLILPYWGGDFERLLDALVGAGMVVKYVVDGHSYGWIRTFTKHQAINNRELPSVLPAPDASRRVDDASARGLNAAGYVYVASYPGAGAFKVGYSSNDPSKRVGDLSCGSPEPLHLVEYISGTISLEAEIHQALAKHRKHREWFIADDASCRALLAWFTRDPRVSVPVERIGIGIGIGIGMGDGIGIGEGCGEVAEQPAADAAPTSLPAVREVFAEWQHALGHPHAKLDPKRTALIRKALKLHTPEQLEQAIRGALKDDWLMGTAPKSEGHKYDGIETILRDTAQIERLIDLETGKTKPPMRRTNGSLQPDAGRTGAEGFKGIRA
jgi:hypothetical protein